MIHPLKTCFAWTVIACLIIASAPTASAAAKACNDGTDNDVDGLTDYPNDPGCTSATDNNEYNAPPAACADGSDNDGDGATDYPSDPGCSSASDTSERGTTACDDGSDNDSDGLTDYPNDPGCTSATDNNEYNPPAACGDGSDNDGDGSADYPNDPGCSSATDASERGTIACDDGLDNDGDGLANYPHDPGCTSATDTNERGSTACDDASDNDADGTSDYPADTGCTGPGDSSEEPSPLPAPLCPGTGQYVGDLQQGETDTICYMTPPPGTGCGDGYDPWMYLVTFAYTPTSDTLTIAGTQFQGGHGQFVAMSPNLCYGLSFKVVGTSVATVATYAFEIQVVGPYVGSGCDPLDLVCW